MNVRLKSVGGRVGEMQVGDARFRAFMNMDPDFGILRMVLEDEIHDPNPTGPVKRQDPSQPDVNTLEMADGMLRVWARFVRNQDEAGRPGATSLSSHLRLGFRDMSLDQLARAGAAMKQPLPGRVNGSTVLWGTTGIRSPKAGITPQGTDPSVPASAAAHGAAGVTERRTLVERVSQSLYGDGQVSLENADIGNFGPIASLYGLMHLGGDVRQPTGKGNISFRVEANAMNITSLRYFNRGVEVRAQATVKDLDKMPLSELNGVAVGTARPLKNAKLPIFETILPDVDKLLAAIQGDAVSIQIGGTVGKPEAKALPFNSIGEGMRQFLVGDVRAETRGSAGQ